MLIRVKDKEGNIYTNEMSKLNNRSILALHFCTSYTQVNVQDRVELSDGKYSYPEKDIIIPLNNGNWIDMIAIEEDEIGEWC